MSKTFGEMNIYEKLGFKTPANPNPEIEKNLEKLFYHPRHLTRQQYETECQKYGITATDDANIIGSIGNEFYEFHPNYHSLDRFADNDFFLEQMDCILRQERYWVLKDEKAKQPKQTRVAQKETAPKPFGASGTRYDEECAGCGKVVDVIDNDSELCERCYSKFI